MGRLSVVAVGLVLLLVGTPVLAGALFDPVTGYRIERYRAPTPAEAPGATTVGPDDVATLGEAGALLIDVGPRATLDPDGPRWLTAEPRTTVAGAFWLPEVGRGKLDPVVEDYLATTLTRLSAGDTARAIVVFCNVDCWMSWNAAQRIAALGYADVNWFPGGADEWIAEDRPTAAIMPEPFAP